MATLGTYTLIAAFIASAYAAAASVAGHRRRSNRLLESGIGTFYLVTALMTLASAIIVRAFVTETAPLQPGFPKSLYLEGHLVEQPLDAVKLI